MTPIRPIRAASRWFFRPGSARTLATIRVATNAYTLVYLARRWRLINKTAQSGRSNFKPVGVARPLKRPLPPRAVKALTIANYASLACAGLGVGYRVSGPVNAALSWWTLTYRNSWSMVFHSDNLAVMHLTALGLSPAADALSVDALVSRGLGRVTTRASWSYGWPIQTINATTAAVYVICGVAKLRGPLGVRWATGAHLRSQVAVDGVRKAALRPDADRKASPYVKFIERHQTLWAAFAAGSLVMELAAPIALVNRRLGRLWSLGAWSMHIGIRLIMHITFRYQLAGVPYMPMVLQPAAVATAVMSGRTAAIGAAR